MRKGLADGVLRGGLEGLPPSVAAFSGGSLSRIHDVAALLGPAIGEIAELPED